jgi:hypothetical protein
MYRKFDYFFGLVDLKTCKENLFYQIVSSDQRKSSAFIIFYDAYEKLVPLIQNENIILINKAPPKRKEHLTKQTLDYLVDLFNEKEMEFFNINPETKRDQLRKMYIKSEYQVLPSGIITLLKKEFSKDVRINKENNPMYYQDYLIYGISNN